MELHGYKFIVEQVQDKFTNFQTKYKRKVDKMNQSGGSGAGNKWWYLKDFEEIFEKDKSVNLSEITTNASSFPDKDDEQDNNGTTDNNHVILNF